MAKHHAGCKPRSLGGLKWAESSTNNGKLYEKLWYGCEFFKLKNKKLLTSISVNTS